MNKRVKSIEDIKKDLLKKNLLLELSEINVPVGYFLTTYFPDNDVYFDFLYNKKSEANFLPEDEILVKNAIETEKARLVSIKILKNKIIDLLEKNKIQKFIIAKHFNVTRQNFELIFSKRIHNLNKEHLEEVIRVINDFVVIQNKIKPLTEDIVKLITKYNITYKTIKSLTGLANISDILDENSKSLPINRFKKLALIFEKIKENESSFIELNKQESALGADIKKKKEKLFKLMEKKNLTIYLLNKYGLKPDLSLSGLYKIINKTDKEEHFSKEFISKALSDLIEAVENYKVKIIIRKKKDIRQNPM